MIFAQQCINFVKSRCSYTLIFVKCILGYWCLLKIELSLCISHLHYLRDIVHAAFVDTVVCEVHAAVVQLLTRSLVAYGGKASKTLLVKVNPQWVVGCDGNIET